MTRFRVRVGTATFRLVVTIAAVVALAAGATAQAIAAPRTDRGKPAPTPTTTTTTVNTVTVTLEIAGQDSADARVAWTLTHSVDSPIPSSPRSCDVDVPTGSPAVAVLDAAVAKGCIQRYEVRYEEKAYPSVARHYVHCVDDACNTTAGTRWSGTTWLAGGGLEWAQYDNGRRVWMIDYITADEGDVLRLAYRAAAGACVPFFAFSAGIQCLEAVDVR